MNLLITSVSKVLKMLSVFSECIATRRLIGFVLVAPAGKKGWSWQPFWAKNTSQKVWGWGLLMYSAGCTRSGWHPGRHRAWRSREKHRPLNPSASSHARNAAKNSVGFGLGLLGSCLCLGPRMEPRIFSSIRQMLYHYCIFSSSKT